MSLAYRLARPLLFAIEPETSHRFGLRLLGSGLLPRVPPDRQPSLRRKLLGLEFLNPVGLAAGLDKNGEMPDALLNLGFGFVEVGTVTPRPQPGNPSPRLFRLPADLAIINRLGFNNDGHHAVHGRLARRKGNGIVGVNIGANRDSPDRVADYVLGVTRFADVADYLAINVSSPNTPGLRDLQEKAVLLALLEAVVAARGSRSPPLLVKIAPDLDDRALSAIAETAIAAGIDGMIVANTTTARSGLRDPLAREAGGLSGRPLFRRSTVMLAKLRKQVGHRFALIGVGGVDSAETAFAKIAAGADLAQLYTGMIYQGPGLVRDVVDGLARLLEQRGFASVEDAVGSEADRWCTQSV